MNSKKFKIIIIDIIIISLIMNTGVFAARHNEKDIKIWVNGYYIMSDVYPFIYNNLTFVPIRFVSEELGYKVTWDNNKKIVNLKKDDVNIYLKIGSKKVKRNKESITLVGSPKLYEDRTFVPLRFISESINENIKFDNKTKTIFIGNSNYSNDNMYKIKFYFKNNNALISNYYVDFNRNLIYRNYNILEKIFNKKKLNNYNANKGKDYFCILNNERDLINYIQNDVVRFNEGESSNDYSDKIQDIDYKKINYNPMKYMTNGKTPLIVNDTIMKTVKFKTNEGNYDEFTGKWEGKAFWGPHWDYDITLNIRKEDNNKYSVIVSSFYDFKDKIYTDTGERYFGRGKVIYECSGSFNKETSEFILEAPNKTIKKTGCFNNEKFHFKDDYNSSKTLKYDRKNNTFEIQYDYFLTKVSK